MKRPLERHLDEAELDALVLSSVRAPGSGKFPEQLLQDVQHHLNSCEDCSRKVQMHRSAQSEISRLGQRAQASAGPDCWESGEWLKLAAGLLPETAVQERMKHAAQCGHCGPLLRIAVETLSDEVTPAEEQALAELDRARPERRKEIAEILSGRTPVSPPRSRSSWWQGLLAWPRPAYGFAAVAVAVAAGWLGVRALRPPSAEQLLATAYTEQRTLELRIPGAEYGPVRVERGSGSSRLNRPPELLKAEAMIAEELAKRPSDATWLQAKARAELLEGDFSAAIAALNQVQQMTPAVPQLLTDMGTAYFQRAEATDNAADYGAAIQQFGEALSQTPDDPIALFNRAIAEEHILLYHEAIVDWEHYLRIDPDGRWADEARQRLDAVQKKLKPHSRKAYEPLPGPVLFASTVQSSDSVSGQLLLQTSRMA